MMLPVQRHSKALDDMVRYASFIGRDNLDAAERFINTAKDTFEFLGRNPFIGRVRTFHDKRLSGLRSWRIAGFQNHLVFYRINEDQVEIIRVIHGAMDLEQQLL